MLGTIDSPLWHTLVPSRRRANWPLTHCDAGRGVAYSLALAPNAVRVRVRVWGYGEEVIKSADAEKCGWGGSVQSIYVYPLLTWRYIYHTQLQWQRDVCATSCDVGEGQPIANSQ